MLIKVLTKSIYTIIKFVIYERVHNHDVDHKAV